MGLDLLIWKSWYSGNFKRYLNEACNMIFVATVWVLLQFSLYQLNIHMHCAMCHIDETYKCLVDFAASEEEAMWIIGASRT
jgi:hypothetical protein